jgi:hypothetical protein
VASGGTPLEACGDCRARPARNERLFTFQLGGTGETLTECWECYTLSYLRCRDCWRIFVATDMYGCLCENCLENHPGYPDECDCEGCEWERLDAPRPLQLLAHGLPGAPLAARGNAGQHPLRTVRDSGSRSVKC